MFLFDAFKSGGEPPRKKREYSKGYPAVRTPAAENPKGIIPRT